MSQRGDYRGESSRKPVAERKQKSFFRFFDFGCKVVFLVCAKFSESADYNIALALQEQGM